MTLFRYFYYEIKPYIPFRLRLSFRRALARRVLEHSQDVWPILQNAAQVPEGWPGWPEEKRFALVLTHDVEGQKGLDRTLKLAELEESLGLRSSFNFVPEGSYQTPKSVRRELSDRGFEVGIHDLHHDGKLYRSQQSFRRAAVRINHYLHEWNATGFRSGFMHHNLQWLHHLDIGYDMSTFDTDPFEPQPDGVHTIFPFWVQKPFDDKFRQDTSPSRTFPGYSELPYTLPQDSTLFLLLEHTSPHVWKTKLDWIAKHGGMALLNVHPDYLSFSGAGELGEYPAKMYSEFLEYVLTNYRNQFWLALPSEVAAYAREVVALGTNFVSRSGDPREIRGKVPLVV